MVKGVLLFGLMMLMSIGFVSAVTTLTVCNTPMVSNDSYVIDTSALNYVPANNSINYCFYNGDSGDIFENVDISCSDDTPIIIGSQPPASYYSFFVLSQFWQPSLTTMRNVTIHDCNFEFIGYPNTIPLVQYPDIVEAYFGDPFNNLTGLEIYNINASITEDYFGAIFLITSWYNSNSVYLSDVSIHDVNTLGLVTFFHQGVIQLYIDDVDVYNVNGRVVYPTAMGSWSSTAFLTNARLYDSSYILNITNIPVFDRENYVFNHSYSYGTTGLFDVSNVDFTILCNESWIENDSVCDGVSYTVLFSDASRCGTINGLPASNGTVVNCGRGIASAGSGGSVEIPMITGSATAPMTATQLGFWSRLWAWFVGLFR
jgi:hypothetical protein